MTLQRDKIQVGTKLWYSREQHEVIALNATTTILKSLRTGNNMTVAVADLLTSGGFSTVIGGKKEEPSTEALQHAVPCNMPAEQTAKAKALLKHLLEALTGFKSGTVEDALPHEPRDEYDVGFTTLTSRMLAKAKELGIGNRAMWNYHEGYRKFGLYGLADQRAMRIQKSGTSVIVSQAIDRVVHRLNDKSNLSPKRIIAMVAAEVRAAENLPEDFRIPSDSTLKRQIFAREDAKRLLKSAKSRRNANNRPRKAYTRFHATRAGEVILIDSSPLDAFAMHPVTHKWVSLEMTIAIDLYTRSVVGWRFTGDTKAVDAALLLGDIISPKRSREFFGDPMAKPFVGIPASIVTRLCTEEENTEHGHLVGIPFLHPESVLIDQGKVFLSDTFRMAAAHLGINVMLARPYTPTDKAQVERMFRTIREQFVQGLPGYKGPDIHSRGAHPEDDAYYYLHEIDELFRQWVAEHWQNRQHDGLFLSVVPTLELTPNQMLEESVARAGFMHVLPDQDTYYELLPVVWRKIHHYGVDTGLLRYDSSALDPYRDTPSPYPNVSDGQWPFRQDPRDRSVLIFWDPETKVWHQILWTGANYKHRPFDDKTLAYAKQVAFDRLGAAPTRKDVERALQDFLDNMNNVSGESRKARMMLAKAAIQATQLAKDRRGTTGPKAGKDPFGSSGQPQTAMKAPEQPSKSWALPPPMKIQPVSEGDEDEGEDADSLREQDDLPRGGSLAAPIKPVEEAEEDDDDDLAY